MFISSALRANTTRNVTIVCWYHQIRLYFIICVVIVLNDNQVLGTTSASSSGDDDEPLRQGDGHTTTAKEDAAMNEFQQQRKQQRQQHQEGKGQPPPMTSEVEDEASLLDLFGESAKDFLTHRLIPTTDASCRWNWKNLRCESHCDCSFQPSWGDYHLGRSCRSRITPLPNDQLATCHLPPSRRGDRDLPHNNQTTHDGSGATITNDNHPLHLIRIAIQSTRYRVEPLVRKINLDWTGRMAIVKGEVCESWLSSGSANIDDDIPPLYDNEEEDDANPFATPIDGGVTNDGGVLSKPIRKLRKIFKCEA